MTIILVLSVVVAPVSSAANDEAMLAADYLNKLGLFNGTGIDENGKPIYDLDRSPTRHEAVTMLVRLLGKESEAKSKTWNIPFADVSDWAKPYVGYAYENRLVNGTSSTTYSGDNIISASEYITLVLRVLEYNSDNDFQWDKAWELSDTIGLTDGRYNTNFGDFNRGDVAIISRNALNCKFKGKSETLINFLGLDIPPSENYIAATEIDIAWDSLDNYLVVGQSHKLQTTITPANATNQKITWSIDEEDEQYATVDSDGTVTAIKPGYAFVWARLPDGPSTFAVITIKGKSPVKLTDITSQTNFVGGTTWTFDVTNTGNKTMKYVTVYWRCYNAVGDPLYDMISHSDRFACRITGPIAPGASLNRIQNSRPFYNYDFANTIGLIEIVIDYMDGSVEVVTPIKYTDYWDL